MWGSICPDILPKYKLIRHYYDDSIDYIVLKIAKLIFFNRSIDFGKNNMAMRSFSRDVGVISHYLADFMCQAHAFEWSLPKTPIKHLKYESELNLYARDHKFDRSRIEAEFPVIEDNRILNIVPEVRDFIEEVMLEYKENQQGFVNDLNYALSLNVMITEYIVESILADSPVASPVLENVYAPV